MANICASIVRDLIFCVLLGIFVHADQALLAHGFRARGEINLRPVRALPWLVLGGLLGLLVLPIYYCVSRGGRHGVVAGFAVIAAIAVLGSVSQILLTR